MHKFRVIEGGDKAIVRKSNYVFKTVDSDLDKDDYNCVIDSGELVWRCNCGHLLFFVTPDGFQCRRCGTRTTGELD